MPTAPRRDIVAAAYEKGSAIGAFNVVLLEHAEAIATGAADSGCPVVFQISQNCARFHGELEPLALATMSIARSLDVEALVHLDHADDPELALAAIGLGFDSVMFDGSVLPYAENVAMTRVITEAAHARGVRVEAELGKIGGKDGVHAPGARTDPAEAAAFVSATGVDWLAVAVGTSHAMTTRDARVDDDLIAALAGAVPAPLVLHGSSGLSDDQLQIAVRSGIAKVNISTHLNALFTSGVRSALDAGSSVDPRRYIGRGRDAVAHEVGRLLELLHGS